MDKTYIMKWGEWHKFYQLFGNGFIVATETWLENNAGLIKRKTILLDEAHDDSPQLTYCYIIGNHKKFTEWKLRYG